MRFTRIVLVILFAVATASAQVSTGTPQFASIGGGPFDAVNLGNLNVHFAIPVLNKAGRGTPFTYDLAYDSSVWAPVTSSGVTSWQPVGNWGWSSNTAALLGYVTATYTVTTQQGPPCTVTTDTWSNYVYHDSLGRQHPFAGSTWTKYIPCNHPPTSASPELTGYATDGSGFSIAATEATWTVTSASGAILSGPLNSQTGASTYTDQNGNEMTVNSSGQYFDTLSGTTPALTVAGSGTPASPTTFTYTAPSGNAAVTMNYTQYTVATNFGFTSSPTIHEYGPTSVALVSSISLPDGTSYALTYEETPGSCTPLANTFSANCVTGRIAEVSLPTGGSISYSYIGGTKSTGIFSDGSTAGLSRALSTGGTWTYTRVLASGTPGPGSKWTTTVSDALPTSNTTVINFAEDGATNGASTAATYNLYETQRQVYQGANSPGNLLETVVRCYNTNYAGCSTATVTSPIYQQDAYTEWPNGETRLSEVFYNGSYSGSGFVSQDNEYDYGVSMGAAPGNSHRLTQTMVSYASLGNGIVGKPSSVTVNDWTSGSAVLSSSTTFGYDASGTLTSTSGTPQHVAITGSRGNLTTVTYQYNSSSSLTQNYTYYDTGNVNTATDVNGATTTYNYGSNSCGNSFSDSISEPLSLSRSMTWNCTAGVETGITDENLNTTSYTHNDPFDRISEIDYPDQGKTTFGYWNSVQTGIYSYQNSSTFTDSEVLVDGLGRPSRAVISNGQTSNPPWYQTDSCYDANGNLSFQPYPYQGYGWGTQQCSTSGDTYSSDALGRVLKVTHADNTTQSWTYTGRATQFTDEYGVTRITQADGLGRTTIVCEIASGANLQGNSGLPANCGTDFTGVQGYVTSYSYSLANHTTTIAQGVQTRTFQTDWLGRTTEIVEPESGTTTFSYAYNSTGLVVTRIRPKANQTSPSVTSTTTTQYDKLGRILSISYDGTLAKAYGYDASAGWGAPTQSNLKGRLSYAYAKVSNSNTPIAETIFSYDSMGRILALGECTPSNCGTSNFIVSATYDWKGNMTQFNDAFGPTYTYSYTRASELSSITSSWNDSNHPAGLLSNVTFGPSGPLTWTIGNGLTGIQSYDSLGRVSGGWVCGNSSQPNCTGGTSYYGFTSSWVGALQTGGCDTVLNQCNSDGYDAFERLVSKTVTQGASQNYSYAYDRWGNRWQENQTSGSGGPQPQLSFNTSNNQVQDTCSNPPVVGHYCYDAAGNMTSDTNHTYTYDAEGNVIQEDGGQTATYTYDALNHRVRTSAYSEFIFDPQGRKVSEWDPTDGFEVTGLTYWGGARLSFYFNGTTEFEHQDSMGTERARTNVTGQQATGNYSSLPFGDGYQVTYGSDDDPYHFATLDQDNSANEHAQFREYSNIAGRWFSPDPYQGSYDFNNPQSFNRYTYALNNPLSFIDPMGLNQLAPGVCDSSQILCPGGDLGLNDYNGDPLTYALGFGGIYPGYGTVPLFPLFGIPTGTALGALGAGFGAIYSGEDQNEQATFFGLSPSAYVAPNNPYQMIKCTGVGRGLAGNTNLVGRQGGIPGQTVQLNTAAVTPTQFNVPNGAALSPFAPYINGTVGNAYFNSITDVNGGKSPIPGVPVRTALQQLFPGQLILEIPGAKDQGANAPVTINVPQSLGCPAGTHF